MTDHVTERITCPECRGSGDDPAQPWRVCTYCMGIGAVHVNKPEVHDVPARQYEDEPPGRDVVT